MLTLVILMAPHLPAGAQAQQGQGQGVASALQAFGSLSADQQQALLQKFSGQGGTTSGNFNQPTAARPPAQGAGQGATGAAVPGQPNAPAGPPTLQPGATVLIQLNLPGQKTVAQLAADAYGHELQQANLAATSAAAAAGLAANAPGQGQGMLPGQGQGQGQAGAAPASSDASPGATPGPELQPQQLEMLQTLVDLVRKGNPYRLNGRGELILAGFRPIALAGLTDAQATQRLAAEAAFANLEVKVLQLPVANAGTEALQPYGYDLFSAGQQALSQAGDVVVPPDYIVQPGDELDVQLYGNQNTLLQLVVSRDGQVNFPQLGPIGVAGKSYATVKHEIESRVARQMIGVRASLAIGQLGTISVFVLGEAMAPGAYPLSGTATVTKALFAAGGVKTKGSLRRIEVRRQGKLVREFDLYDLLMRGDSSNDVKLIAGDVVMVPSIGPTVAIDGEVQRPALYELKGSPSVADAVQMAGGLTPEGDGTSVSMIHLNGQLQRVVMNVPADAGNVLLGNGDVLRVPRLRPLIDSGVTLQGHVWRPGNFAWHAGLRIADVIPMVDELQPGADQHYVLIRRERPSDHKVLVLSADLAAAWVDRNSAANVALESRDTLTVFDTQTVRDRVIEPLMQEINQQASSDSPLAVVQVMGRVRVPGSYPLEQGMHVVDLLRAGGGLAPEAYSGRAELSRFEIIGGEQRRVAILPIDLGAVARGDAAANMVLQPYDQLSVKDVSNWNESDSVTLTGEVKLPGIYTIRRGETLRSVIERAGGLTQDAFLQGSVFMRQDLREREQQELDRLAVRMQHDITAMSLSAARVAAGTGAGAAAASGAISVGKTLVAQLQATKALGRLVIDLPAVLNANPGSADDLVMRDGDSLVIPRKRQEVMVLGEVQNASSQLYQPDFGRDDYISQSGGLTRQADKSHIYVVRADGRVVAQERGFLFSFANSVGVKPGDAIVVPMNTEKMPALPLWQSVTQILYNIAIAAAAVHAL